MATPFATSTDYTSRGLDVSAWSSTTTLDARLAAASRWLRAMCAGIDDRIAAKTLDADLVTDIVCQMVARTVPALPVGLEQTQMTAGPYSTSSTATNPHGDFYLTKNEKLALGCGSKAFMVDLMPNPDIPRF